MLHTGWTWEELKAQPVPEIFELLKLIERNEKREASKFSSGK